MKLALLVVVAVAVLPSFSESRIVSKCELRDKLGKMIHLPGRLGERVLATVICEVERMSHLNTGLVKSFGKCIPATPKPTAPAATGANKMANGAVTPPNTNSTSTNLTNTTATGPIKSTTTAMNAAFGSKSTGGVKRPRRHAHSGSGEEFSGDDSEMEDKDETSSEADDKSKGLYGLFQLSDRKFCDSGLCPSKNMCHASCKAFTDDNITDDIACVIQTGYWRDIMDRASESCRRTWNFFKECN